tara:strand:- start:217 stop:579 length:363 start_codon:yes stop_codon:yes gene_type:complete
MILPITIKSRNVIDKFHWAKKSRLKQEYALLIRNQMRLNKIEEIEQPNKPIINLYILSIRSRLLDEDNLVGGCKQLIDALCDENYIYDDAPKYTRIIVDQVKNKEVSNRTLHNKTYIRKS